MSGLHNSYSVLFFNCRELVRKLHENSISVYLVSGGFRELIGPVAAELNIPVQNVYANRLKFYFNGTSNYMFLRSYKNQVEKFIFHDP